MLRMGDVFEADLHALAQIWRECFGDGEAYVRMFYAGHTTMPIQCAAFDGGEPVAMLHALRARMRCENGSMPLFFGYAVGVRKAYRRRGIFRAMTEAAIAQAQAMGGLYVITPPNAEVARYYRGFGMKEAFFLRRLTFAAQPVPARLEFAFAPISAAEYKRLRDARFDRPGYVCWDEAAIAYALAENAFCGGFSHKLMLDGGEYNLMGAVTDGVLHIRETTLPAELLAWAAAALRTEMEFEKAVFDMPRCGCSAGEEIVSGMAAADVPPNGYLNLLLN